MPMETPLPILCNLWVAMSDLVETSRYDELTDRIVTRTRYDNSDVLAANLEDRNAAPEFGKYKGNFAHVGRVHMGDIVRLKNLGYNLLSADSEEVRRALLYIQSEEPHLLTVPGKPFAKKRVKWE